MYLKIVVGVVVTINNSYCDGEMVTILGCTDESALNYNSNANQDDGSYFEIIQSYVLQTYKGCIFMAVWDPVCGVMMLRIQILEMLLMSYL